MQPNLVILFVYGIDRGSLSVITDYHGAGSAGIRKCNLYSLIITPVGMKKGWKRFINDLSVPSRFLYLDEFQQEFKILDPQAPAIYIQTGKAIHQIITAGEINHISSTDQLAELVKQRLIQYFR